MRGFLLLWVLPISFLGGWYFLSLNDLHFGMHFFSRQMHDLVFTIYGNALGIAPETIPPLVAKAIVMDTGIVLLIVAYRRRKPIAAFLRERGLFARVLTSKRGQSVERPLQDEGGRGRIDAIRAFGAGHVDRQKPAFGRNGRETLVPQGDGAVVQP